MASPSLTPAQMQEAVDAVAEHGSVLQAGYALNLPRGTMENRVRRAKAAGYQANRSEIPVGMPFERDWKVWLEHIGAARERYAGPAKPKARSGRLSVVAAGDFHIPFHHPGALATLLTVEKDADICVIGGDFGDAHAASTFTKYEHVSYEEEHAGKTLVLSQLSETFPIVKYLKGSNHTDRWEKRLRENLTKDVLDAVLSMTGGILNPDLALVKRYPNVELATWTTPTKQDVSWLTVIGDVALCHAEKYSRVPGSALRSIEEWIDDFTGTLGLPKLRAIIQFHTHAMAVLPYKSDMLLIEPGAMCKTHSYQLGARIAGRPQRLGYVRFELVDGHLDVNSVRLRWLDAEGRI
jgi:hypothetical protein